MSAGPGSGFSAYSSRLLIRRIGEDTTVRTSGGSSDSRSDLSPPTLAGEDVTVAVHRRFHVHFHRRRPSIITYRLADGGRFMFSAGGGDQVFNGRPVWIIHPTGMCHAPIGCSLSAQPGLLSANPRSTGGCGALSVLFGPGHSGCETAATRMRTEFERLIFIIIKLNVMPAQHYERSFRLGLAIRTQVYISIGPESQPLFLALKKTLQSSLVTKGSTSKFPDLGPASLSREALMSSGLGNVVISLCRRRWAICSL